MQCSKIHDRLDKLGIDPPCCYQRSSFKASNAIFRAPSYVLLPPMNPEAWTKTHPGIPVSSDSWSPRTPRHGSGSGSLHREL